MSKMQKLYNPKMTIKDVLIDALYIIKATTDTNTDPVWINKRCQELIDEMEKWGRAE